MPGIFVQFRTCALIIGSAAAIAACKAPSAENTLDAGFAGADWPAYNGDQGGTHYSSLQQINRRNVTKLRLAWSFDTGDAFDDGVTKSTMEANPLIIDGRMYIVSPKSRLICLDAATGAQLWAFDPAPPGEPVKKMIRQRGIAVWRSSGETRLFYSFRHSLIAVDASTGRPISGFGENGRIDIRDGIDRPRDTMTISNVSPGIVFKDLIILGSTGQGPGDIRAYDVRTGRVRWTFHTIPHPGEFGYDTWPKDAWKHMNGVNAWAGMGLDEARGVVFVPLASPGAFQKDFYGADRAGDNLFGTSLVALDAVSGRRIWHFQFVRHDLWDRDPPSPPTLVSVNRAGKTIPAIAQPTKAGILYLFDRRNGQPLMPMTELSAPRSDIPGEQYAKAQRLPVRPIAFTAQEIGQNSLTIRTPAANKAARTKLATLRNDGPFTPPSIAGSVLMPGNDGGAEYGGAAYDPTTGLLYVNANEVASIERLRRIPAIAGTTGQALYNSQCAACHGGDRRGSPPEFPSLVDVAERRSRDAITAQIKEGSGRMPAFPNLSVSDRNRIASYLLAPSDPANLADSAPTAGGWTYEFAGYEKFIDAEGYPANAPPWGSLTAIDVNTGRFVWRIPFGDYPELAALGLRTGTENYGGAIVTAGGLLIIAATIPDRKLHIYDKMTGRLLWDAELPTASVATPATYMSGGRQFIVVAAGGGKSSRSPAGGKILAYALP